MRNYLSLVVVLLLCSIGNGAPTPVIGRLEYNGTGVILSKSDADFDNENVDNIDVTFEVRGATNTSTSGTRCGYILELIYESARAKYAEESKLSKGNEITVQAANPAWYFVKVSRNFVWLAVPRYAGPKRDGVPQLFEVRASVKNADKFIDIIRRNSKSRGFVVPKREREDILSKTKFKVEQIKAVDIENKHEK